MQIEPFATNPSNLARDLLRRHGLRAAAVAQEHAAQARLAGQSDAFDRWCAVERLIELLRGRVLHGGAPVG